MAFKKIEHDTVIPDSPEKLIRLLSRRKIPDVLPHQSVVMRTYAGTALEHRDVAIQLPTGGGKTIVGLLIGEWRRRRFKEKVVYLCPTKQLVNQVVEQAEEKYGLSVVGFTGSSRDYAPASKADYRTVGKLAVTTYSSLFNTNPFFDDAQIIIVDDAHAAEHYIAAMWSLSIERNKPSHEAIHEAICGVIESYTDPGDFARLRGKEKDGVGNSWINKVSTPAFAAMSGDLTAILDEHAESAGLGHQWAMLRDHLLACQFYVTKREMLIRPLIPPTWTHPPFETAVQRIYMSATLGGGGDLERMTGRRRIHRVPIPEGWDTQGVGRRFFMFPAMALTEGEERVLRGELMRTAGRSIVLTPSEHRRNLVSQQVTEDLGYPVFDAAAIESTKQSFVQRPQAVAVLANRYDGIDFPGEECRLLFVEGFPKSMNLQERFLMEKMGAHHVFNDRIQTRVLQAIGRCTRSLEDYSAVVVSGEELPDYLADLRRTKCFHPELHAEIRFGVEQSKNASVQDFSENLKAFLQNGEEWEDVSQRIVALRAQISQEALPGMDELEVSVGLEVEYQSLMWQSDFSAAFESATKILAGLNHEVLRGYRALWHYAAGSAALLAAQTGSYELKPKAVQQFRAAKKAAPSIPWLVLLASKQESAEAPAAPGAESSDVDLMDQLERVESMLSKLGTLNDRGFAKKEADVLKGIRTVENFEPAHRLLGEMLGFEAGKVESDGSPDPWWICGRFSLVFEDHAGAKPESTLDVTKARQVSSHPNWLKANVNESTGTEILAVLLTPVAKVREGAVPHLEGVMLWKLADFQDWAARALAALREVRVSFTEPGNLVWRAKAAEVFVRAGVDVGSLIKYLKSQPANAKLTPCT